MMYIAYACEYAVLGSIHGRTLGGYLANALGSKDLWPVNATNETEGI
jgi:hypothetical protein